MKPPEQIQSWPTPEIFIRKSGFPVLVEYPRATVALDSMQAAFSFNGTPQDDLTGAATIALGDFLLPGPIKRTMPAELPMASIVLADFDRPLATSRTLADPDSKGAVKLDSFKNLLPTTRTTAEAASVAAIKLDSFVVTP